jgi:hypothetical protein
MVVGGPVVGAEVAPGAGEVAGQAAGGRDAVRTNTNLFPKQCCNALFAPSKGSGLDFTPSTLRAGGEVEIRHDGCVVAEVNGGRSVDHVDDLAFAEALV